MEKILESSRKIDSYRASLKMIDLPITLNESMVLYVVDKGIDTGYAISKYLEKDPATITRLIKSLRSKGFLIRGNSKLSLTESGALLLREAEDQARGLDSDEKI